MSIDEKETKANSLAMKVDKAGKKVETLSDFHLYDNGARVYTPDNKPDAHDINAVKRTGDQMSGELRISTQNEKGLVLDVSNTNADSSLYPLFIDLDVTGDQPLTKTQSNNAIYVDIDSHVKSGDTTTEHRIRGITSHISVFGDSDDIKGIETYCLSRHSEGTSSLVRGGNFESHAYNTGTSIIQDLQGSFSSARVLDDSSGEIKYARGSWSNVGIDSSGGAKVQYAAASRSELEAHKGEIGRANASEHIIDMNEGVVTGEAVLLNAWYEGATQDNIKGTRYGIKIIGSEYNRIDGTLDLVGEIRTDSIRVGTNSPYNRLIIDNFSPSGYNGGIAFIPETSPGTGQAKWLTVFGNRNNPSGGVTKHDVEFAGDINIKSGNPRIYFTETDVSNKYYLEETGGDFRLAQINAEGRDDNVFHFDSSNTMFNINERTAMNSHAYVRHGCNLYFNNADNTGLSKIYAKNGGEYGADMHIIGHGRLCLVGGEGAEAGIGAIGTSEAVNIAADGEINFYSNCNTWANRKSMVFSNNGTLRFGSINGGIISCEGFTTSNKQMFGTSAETIYVGNPQIDMRLETRSNPYVNVAGTGYALYHEGHKPTASEVGAVPLSTTGLATVQGTQAILHLKTTSDVLGKGSLVQFEYGSAKQGVQIRNNQHDSERSPFGLHIEKMEGHGAEGQDAYLEVEGEIVSKSTGAKFTPKVFGEANRFGVDLGNNAGLYRYSTTQDTYIGSKASNGKFNLIGMSGIDAVTYRDGTQYKIFSEGFRPGGTGYRIFTVGGDANTCYPVVVGSTGSSGYGMQRFSLSRYYAWTAPDTWNTSTHKGGLTLTWEWSGDGTWGGNDKTHRFIQFAESYTNMVGGFDRTTSGDVVYLRGGGATYAFRADCHETAPRVYLGDFTSSDDRVWKPRAWNSTEATNGRTAITAMLTIRGDRQLWSEGNVVITTAGGTIDGTTVVKGQLRNERGQNNNVNFNEAHIRVTPSSLINSTGTTTLALAVSTAANYGWSINAWRNTTGGDSGYMTFNHHNNSATGVVKHRFYNNGAFEAMGKISCTGTGNDYNTAAVELRVPTGSLYPSLGFHSPGKFAGVLQQRTSNDFYLMRQGGSAYANLCLQDTYSSGGHYRRSHSRGCLIGSYNNIGPNSNNTNPIYTIGSNYLPSDTTLGNMYGIGYCTGTAPFIESGIRRGSWGMYVASDGNARIFLDGSNGNIQTVGQLYASGNKRVYHEGYLPSGVTPAVYSGTDKNNTNFPIGSTLLVTRYNSRPGSWNIKNATCTLYNHNSTHTYLPYCYQPANLGSGYNPTALPGTWRARGAMEGNGGDFFGWHWYCLYQRIA